MIFAPALTTVFLVCRPPESPSRRECSGNEEATTWLDPSLRNWRTAAGFLDPRIQADLNGDQTKLARLLKSAAIWLTPAAVEGYVESDFSEMSAETRETLTSSVADFESVSRQIPSNQPASPDQLRRALPPFLKMLKALDGYLDPEAVRCINSLMTSVGRTKCLVFPAGPVRFDGRPICFRATIVLRDEVPASPEFARITSDLRHMVRDVLEKNGIDRWPYVRFTSASETNLLFGIA